ncbi:MAG: hypothetical protein MZV70_43170 [Desulfobacterales bacterium]|nr:hypothetical protein [Desulfobacterales bacterium]
MQLGRIEVRGENGVLALPTWALTRQRSNPFHSYLIERLDAFVGQRCVKAVSLPPAASSRSRSAPGCCSRCCRWLTHCATAPRLDGVEPSYAIPPDDAGQLDATIRARTWATNQRPPPCKLVEQNAMAFAYRAVTAAAAVRSARRAVLHLARRLHRQAARGGTDARRGARRARARADRRHRRAREARAVRRRRPAPESSRCASSTRSTAAPGCSAWWAST